MTAPGRGTALRGSLIVVIASAACAAVVACSGFSSSEGSTDDAGVTNDSTPSDAESSADGAMDGGVPNGDASVFSCVDAGTCKRVFVTSQQWDGLLGGSGGIDEGNSRCREAAAAFDGGANWVAWLSDGFNHRALARVGKGEWILTDGTLAAVFTTDDPKTVGPSGLTLVHQINRTELGAEVAVAVWTGTGATGGAASACGAWRRTDLMGTTGLSSSSKTEWTTASSTSSCAAPASLYCFEE